MTLVCVRKYAALTRTNQKKFQFHSKSRNHVKLYLVVPEIMIYRQTVLAGLGQDVWMLIICQEVMCLSRWIMVSCLVSDFSWYEQHYFIISTHPEMMIILVIWMISMHCCFDSFYSSWLRTIISFISDHINTSYKLFLPTFICYSAQYI